VKFLYDTVVAHGMSVGQLKQAILSELAEKQLMDSVPLNWFAHAVLICDIWGVAKDIKPLPINCNFQGCS